MSTGSQERFEDDLTDSFFESLAEELNRLPHIADSNNREDSYMTAEQIKEWSKTELSPEEIDQALLDRWQLGQLQDIRPAKYPHQRSLLRLWGNKKRLYALDPANLKPLLLDEPLELEPFNLPDDAAQIFVSFSSVDLELALEVRNQLAKLGLRTWLYIEQIQKWNPIFEVVRKGLLSCKAVIGLITRTSIGSAWVYSELHAAEENKKPVFAVFDSGDKELLDVLKTCYHAGSPDVNLSLDRLVKWYSEKGTGHHSEGYRQGAINLLNSLQRYSDRILFPQRPLDWEDDRGWIEFHTIKEKVTSRP